MNNHHNLKNLCLYWLAPGIAIFVVSFFAAMRFAEAFNGDGFTKSAIFIIGNAVGWFTYIVLQSLLVDLCWLLPYFFQKRDNGDTYNTTRQEPPSAEPAEFVLDSGFYSKRNADVERQRKEKREKMLFSISEYIQYIMSPYLKEEDVPKLVGEIMSWAADLEYKPRQIELRNRELSNIDLRHFIWNIGERLGQKNGYTGENRACFARALFPYMFKGMSTDSIRNFKVKAANELIPIDVPDNHCFAFHYPELVRKDADNDKRQNDLQIIG